jgi:hypothetical protein
VSAQEAFDALADLLRASPPIEIATVAKPARGEDQQQARHLPLRDSADAFFRRITAEAVIDATEPELRPLDITHKPEPGTIEWVELDQVDAVKAATERFASLGVLSSFEPNDEAYKKRLLFWLARRWAGGEQAFFFRAFSASAELKRKNFAAIALHDGAFARIEEQIFMFDENIDCVVFGGYIFVLRKGDYRRIFDQLEQLRDRAKQAAERLHAKVPIANLEEFTAACETQPGMADKLIAVQGRDYFARLNYEMLKPVIEEFELDIATENRNGRTHLVFKSDAGHRWRILRLVDDDFLRSSMTDHRYEVNSKTDATQA